MVWLFTLTGSYVAVFAVGAAAMAAGAVTVAGLPRDRSAAAAGEIADAARRPCRRLPASFALAGLAASRDSRFREGAAMSDRYIVGDLVAEFLQAVGVTTAFGLVSVHNIPMLDAIGRRNAIRFVKARRAWRRPHGRCLHSRQRQLAVLFTSTGRAANGIPALVEAGFAGTPLIHITGQTASGNIDRDQGPVHDLPGQLAMLESVSKSAYRVRDAASALGTLTRAVSDALTPPMGPVSIEIPIDVQRTAIDRPAALDGQLLALPAPAPAPTAQLDEAAAMLRAAKRPMLWTGNGAKFAGAAVRRLVDMGLPLATSWNGRAVIPEDHPRNFAGLYAAPELVEFYQSVDLLIVAGCRLRAMKPPTCPWPAGPADSHRHRPGGQWPDLWQ